MALSRLGITCGWSDRTPGVLIERMSAESRADDLRAFARELVADMERDLGTKLDWIAVDHYNTDNPHVHLLIRARQRTAAIW